MFFGTSGFAQGTNKGTPRDVGSRDSVAKYIEHKDREFLQSKQALGSLGAAQNVTPLYNLLREKGSFKANNVVGKDDTQRGQVRDALAKTAATYLAATGMSPSELNELTRDGIDPIASVQRVITGNSSILDDITVAELPVLGTLTSLGAGAGGLEVSMTFTVEDNIKSDRSLGESVSFNVQLTDNVASLKPGAKCVLFLSETLKRFRAASGRRSTSGKLQQQLQPYCLSGTNYTKVVSSSIPMTVSATEAMEIIARFQKK